MSHLILAEGFAHAYDFMLVFHKGDPKGDAPHGRSHSRSLRNEVSGPCWSAPSPAFPGPQDAGWAGAGAGAGWGSSPLTLGLP